MALEIRTAVIADAEAIQRIYAPIVLKTAISFEEMNRPGFPRHLFALK